MTNNRPALCLIEDDPIMGESLCVRFELEGFSTSWLRTCAEAEDALNRREFDVVISDIRLPDRSGEELYRELRERGSALPPFIFITGYGAIDRAVALLKLGAADYITKPFDLDEVIGKVRSLTEVRPDARGAGGDENVLGISPAMRKIAGSIVRFAKRARTVIVSGESGVGKEHVAAEVHRHARISENCPFVAVNCAAVPETLLESELFGHQKGAFTGATRNRKGYFERADCGTLFLDEIGEMPPAMQVKLLRAIQDRRITRVGGDASIDVDFLLICATNRDLRQLVERGRFREDLYYRINVIHLHVPPLRERPEDVLWFARRFLEEMAGAPGKGPQLHPAAEQALLAHSWEGNVRELKHCMERAYIMCGGAGMLGPEVLFEDSLATGERDGAAPRSLNEYLAAREREYIVQVLERHQRHVSRTAEELGISRKNLWEKMRKLGISEPRPSGTGDAD